MLKNHIASKLRENLPYEPTPSQENLMEVLAGFISGQGERDCLLIKGYAGTGKTTLVHSLVKTLGRFRLRTVLMAPTGRAAKVLSSYAGKNANTIHKQIYRQKNAREGLGEFALDRNLYTDTLFVVDEASMISNQSADLSLFGSGRLLDDLVNFVYSGRGCRMVLIGDTAQLPPVGLNISPALEAKKLESYGLQVTEAFLDDIVRQSLDSGILSNATAVRNLISGKRKGLPCLAPKPDVIFLPGADLTDVLGNAYDRNGAGETIVICRSNKRANKYNAGIRNQILYREEEISNGDLLMVVKNNYYWLRDNQEIDFIANGDILEVKRIHGYQDRYGFRFADMELAFPDYGLTEVRVKVMLDTLASETASLGSDESKKLYHAISEDYPKIKSQRKLYQTLRENEFFNALQVKFAYAVTCHKAQGGQWKHVFVDQGYIAEEQINTEYLRWLYTAFTRATEKLYLVNFPQKYQETE